MLLLDQKGQNNFCIRFSNKNYKTIVAQHVVAKIPYLLNKLIRRHEQKIKESTILKIKSIYARQSSKNLS